MTVSMANEALGQQHFAYYSHYLQMYAQWNALYNIYIFRVDI